jgi:hypothetical protein
MEMESYPLTPNMMKNANINFAEWRSSRFVQLEIKLGRKHKKPKSEENAASMHAT